MCDEYSFHCAVIDGLNRDLITETQNSLFVQSYVKVQSLVSKTRQVCHCSVCMCVCVCWEGGGGGG